MIRDELVEVLRGAPAGLPLSSIFSTLKSESRGLPAAAVEALLLLSPDIRFLDGTWRLIGTGRSNRILAAIESYASATGRTIFRAASALAVLAPDEHPTPEELAELIETTGGRFKLLPNSMIRRNL